MWLILPALLQVALGGFVASSGMMLWAVLMPLAAVALLGVRRATPWLIAFGVVLTALAVGNSGLVEHAADFSLPVQTPAHRVEHRRADARRVPAAGLLRRAERARTRPAGRRAGALPAAVANVLPAPIATRLKRPRRVCIADRFDEVTVLFADIVGFTTLVGADAARAAGAVLNGCSRRSTSSPRRTGSRRSRRSATRTWPSAGSRAARRSRRGDGRDGARDARRDRRDRSAESRRRSRSASASTPGRWSPA